jgi:hypothetical protein
MGHVYPFKHARWKGLCYEDGFRTGALENDRGNGYWDCGMAELSSDGGGLCSEGTVGGGFAPPESDMGPWDSRGSV